METPAAWRHDRVLEEMRRLYEADLDDAVRRGCLTLRSPGKLAMTLKGWSLLFCAVLFRDYRRAYRKIGA